MQCSVKTHRVDCARRLAAAAPPATAAASPARPVAPPSVGRSLCRQVRHPLLIGHHVLSVLFFPYATLRHRSLLVVLFFVFTEVW